jgi:hypothetical protein
VANATNRRPPARGPRDWWRGLPARQRTTLRLLLAAGAVLVLVVGALLARLLTVENAERDDAIALIKAETRGELAAMLAQLGGCRHEWLASAAQRAAAASSCMAGARANASDTALRRSGAIKILQLETEAYRSRFGSTGETRLAWTVIGGTAAEGGGQPVVQCLEVRRSGNFLSGAHVRLLALSRPISGEGRCTKETQIEREEEESTAVEQGK